MKYLFYISLETFLTKVSWNTMPYRQSPKSNLMYYGLGLTASRKLILFGGVFEKKGTPTLR
jgi:hypothetical protein